MKSFFQNLLKKNVLTDGLKRFGTNPENVKELGAFENIVYEVLKPDNFIIRFTHSSHRSETDIKAELEFMDYLYAGGVSIPMPRKSVNGSFCEVVDARDGSHFLVSAFAKADGRRPTREDATPKLWRNWGRQIGKMNRLTKDYKPVHDRIHWYDEPYYTNPEKYLSTEPVMLDRCNCLVDEIKMLPTNRDNYGLIHTDVHQGNYFIDDDMEFCIFDFDDLAHMHFVHDLAMVVFYGSMMFPPPVKTEKTQEMYGHVMDGYLSENKLTNADLSTMNLFVDLRWIVVTGQLLVLDDPDDEGIMNQKILNRNVPRINAGESFIDLDYSI